MDKETHEKLRHHLEREIEKEQSLGLPSLLPSFKKRTKIKHKIKQSPSHWSCTSLSFLLLEMIVKGAGPIVKAPFRLTDKTKPLKIQLYHWADGICHYD